MTAEERQRQVDDAIANEKLEGLEVSSHTRKIMDDYVAGKVTADEAAKQVYSRYGV
ncbi:antitoxin VbhA family protein [Candidatus Saccharibacteria bacterium]|nr:antitoxin VbhA family protein [Candidatus Saccharibacteria bacterium]